jgi:hypothetical protein
MVTLERIDAGSALISRRAPGPATSPTEGLPSTECSRVAAVAALSAVLQS